MYKRYLWLVLALLLAACDANFTVRAPGGLTATPGEGQVTLEWQDRSSNETGFAVYRQEVSAQGVSTQAAGELELIATTAPNVTTYVDKQIATMSIKGQDAPLVRYAVAAMGKYGSDPVMSTEVDPQPEPEPEPEPNPPTPPAPTPTPNKAPSANAQAVTTDEDTPVTFTLAGSDPEGSTLIYSVKAQPEHGTLSGDAPELTYTPEENYNGQDSFTFTVSDGELSSDPATVTITIGDVGDPPTDIMLNNESIEENQDAGTTVGTLSATDPDSTDFTYNLPAGEADNASFAVNGDQLQTAETFDFEVKESYSVLVEVSDGELSYQETFTVSVTDVDDEEPTAIFSDDTPSELTLGQEVTITGTASDNVGVSTLALLEVKNGTETKLADLTLNGSDWTYSYTPGKAGDVTLVTLAVDEAGNEGKDFKDVFVTGTTQEGDVTVTTQAGLDALANVSTITGTLRVDSDAAELDFSPTNALKEVGGDLILGNNPNLTDIEGFKNLERVSGAVGVIDNPNLFGIPSFESLEQVFFIAIDNNASLTSIDSFSQVINTDTIYIFFNPKLTSIIGFDKLTSSGVFDSEVIGNTQLDCPAQELTFAPVDFSSGNLVDCSVR